MWDTFYGPSTYIEITTVTCQEGSAATSIIYCPSLFFPTHILKDRGYLTKSCLWVRSSMKAEPQEEHSFEGVPAPLYNLAKSVQAPLVLKRALNKIDLYVIYCKTGFIFYFIFLYFFLGGGAPSLPPFCLGPLPTHFYFWSRLRPPSGSQME